MRQSQKGPIDPPGKPRDTSHVVSLGGILALDGFRLCIDATLVRARRESHMWSELL